MTYHNIEYYHSNILIELCMIDVCILEYIKSHEYVYHIQFNDYSIIKIYCHKDFEKELNSSIIEMLNNLNPKYY